MSISDHEARYSQLLDMLGAKDHEDAARIIAGYHAREIAAQTAERREAVAWMVPSIVSFKGVMRTNCPLEMQTQIEGTVAWHPELIGDSHPVTDRDGVTHNPRPLVYGDTAQPPAAGVPDDAEAVSACLGDDAAAMLEANPEDERALNMQRAAQIIEAMLSAAPEASPHG